jgi:type I restriction enzyme M protein
MSSQASSAGHGEKDVRRKIVETGDIDVMIAIRPNFFYTRTVPCELWFFDRGRPKNRRDRVLMLDARNVYRKVTRKIFDFAPEQLANLTAIVALYRGESKRFVALIRDYLAATCTEAANVPEALAPFDAVAGAAGDQLAAITKATKGIKGIDAAKHEALADALKELSEATAAYAGDRDKLLAALKRFRAAYCDKLPADNKAQHKTRKAFEPLAEELRGLVKQADLICKVAGRARDAAHALADDEAAAQHVDRRGLSKTMKELDEARRVAVEQLKDAGYFHKQVVWLQDRFPDAELVPVPGLVKVVDRGEIEGADWSLTPGRYVGVAPPEPDEDFDFEEAIRDIHVEIAGLNDEAAELAKTIQANFEELGV